MSKKIDKEFFVAKEAMKQNQIEDILVGDEEILLRLKPNRKVYRAEALLRGLPIVLLWAGIDATFIYILASFTDIFKSFSPKLIFIIFFFTLHLLPVWAFIATAVKKLAEYKNVDYAITDKRIIVRSGVIGVDFKYISYPEINSVNVKVGILDRIFNVGDLYIKSDTQTAVLYDIPLPYQYASKIQEIVRDLKADTFYPNDLRPAENHGYNTKYVKNFDDNKKDAQ